MAVQTLSNHHEWHGMGGYHHGSYSQSMPLDMQPRTTPYSPNYPFQQTMTYYPTYNFQQPQYTQNLTDSYNTGHDLIVPSQMPSYSAPPSAQMPMAPLSDLDTMPRMKSEASPVDSQQGSLHQLPSHRAKLPQLGVETIPKQESSTAAAPGPIPATTPLVVKQDQTGVQWIAFEYSKDRVKQQYTIRCDVKSIDTMRLSDEFKSANCVYPRAYVQGKQYKGNRQGYETACNMVGWALADLNPVLQGKRGLIQRAVDSWRNSNEDPKLRSRRVRRMTKEKTRRDRQNNAASHLPNTIHLSMLPNPTHQTSPLEHYRLASSQLGMPHQMQSANMGALQFM